MLGEAGSHVLFVGNRRVEAADVPVDTVRSETFGERVCNVVDEQVNAGNAVLIVIGTHGRRGVKRLLLGSDAEQILRLARVPVLLVRAAEVEEGRSGKAAETAATMAARIATVAA
jgi:hypothetical protein